MLSVIIIAKNEAHHLERCLESVNWATEIIVLDSGSQDDTVAIARKYTPHVYETDWQGYGVQKQRALQYATQDWVLNLDADECLEEPLKLEIETALSRDDHDAYRIPIRLFFYGKAMKYSSSPQRHIRLFKRAEAAYSKDNVHEKILLPAAAKIGQLRQPIIHYCYRDLTHALQKLNLYSSQSAKIRLNHSQPPSVLGALGSSFWMFFRCYVLQRGFLDGLPGLIFALFRSQESWYRGMKQLYPDQA